jgi:hypothetical protein
MQTGICEDCTRKRHRAAVSATRRDNMPLLGQRERSVALAIADNLQWFFPKGTEGVTTTRGVERSVDKGWEASE